MKKIISRLIGGVSSATVYFAVGTLIAEVIIFAYVWTSWRLDADKIAQMAAIARGREMVAVGREQLRRRQEVPPEQPSTAEIIQARAVKYRNLELRRQALGQDVEQLRYEQTAAAAELTQFKQTRDDFQKKLREIEEYQRSNGLQENIVMLQNMKPKQAKEQLVDIYESGQKDQVVMLVSGIAPAKMKKILSEFNTPEDDEILTDILERIRLGAPLALLASQTLKELESAIGARK